MQLKTRMDVEFWIYSTHLVQIVIFRERGTRLVWAWIDPCPFGQICQIEYFCTGGLSLCSSMLLVLCCDIEVFNPAAQYSMVKPAGVQPFQALMIIGFSLHEFQILLKYAIQIKRI